MEKTQQLEEAEKKLDELEVTFAAKRDDQVAAVRMECVLDKLQDIEALRKNFDKERQAWYHEEWTVWKTAAQGEKDELLLQRPLRVRVVLAVGTLLIVLSTSNFSRSTSSVGIDSFAVQTVP